MLVMPCCEAVPLVHSRRVNCLMSQVALPGTSSQAWTLAFLVGQGVAESSKAPGIHEIDGPLMGLADGDPSWMDGHGCRWCHWLIGLVPDG